jgi:4-hydroxybenzoate polyprenyltransferase
MKQYFSFVKFSHTVFALPFALIGFFLAVQLHRHPFEWYLLALVLVCMVTARNAAMGFNRWADRYIDKDNPRTAVREIPAGVITPGNAIVFVVINCILFISATWFINPICFYLSPVALLVILGYSYTKRFTPLCHLVLGLGLALAPIGAYLAVAGVFHWLPMLFSLLVLFWVSGFDIIYALQDEEFDKSSGLLSIPSRLGKSKALRVSRMLHAISICCVLAIGYLAHFGLFYWIGAGIFSGLLIYQHTLVKPDDLSRVNMAFATTNGIASVVFAIFVLLELFY